MSEISEAINEFFNFDVFDDESDKLYCCDSIVIYKNKLYKSLKDNNDRNPHDDTAWFYIGTLSDIINYIVADDKGYQLDISYYPECSNSCVAMFDKGQCVIDKVIKTDALGIPVKDDCGNVTYDYLIFNSLTDCNTTPPLVGSQANPPTWSQGMTTCEYLNRSVGYTQNGDTEENIISALNRKCLLGCDAPDDETIALATQGAEGTHSQTIGNKLRVIHDNKSIVTSPEKGLEVAVIGRDRAGNPVDVRNNPCFVTCETMGKGLIWDETTKKWIVNIANGLSYTSDGKIQVQPADNSIIVDSNGVKANLSKGLVLTPNGIETKLGNGIAFDGNNTLTVKPADNSIIVDANGVKVGQIGVDRNGAPVNAGACLVTCATDLHVTAIDDTGVNTVITLSDGTTISGPEIDKDDYVVNFVQSGGVLTITMKSGATYSVTLPATQDNYLTNLTIDGNGLITATRNNGLPDLTVQIPKPETLKFPMATYRGAFGPPTTNPVFTGNGKLYFSEWINQSGFFPETLGIKDIPIPRSGWYRIDHRCTARWTGGSPPTGRCSVFKNGTTINGLGINLGTNYFPFMTKNAQEEIPKAVHAYFNAGDLISVETTNMGAGAEIIGETLMIQFVSF